MPDLDWVITPRNGTVRFVVTDDDCESSVALAKGDAQEDVMRKLAKVLHLLGSPAAPPPPPAYAQVQAPEPGPPPVTGNTWARYAEVPDRLKGEVELIEEGEEE